MTKQFADCGVVRSLSRCRLNNRGRSKRLAHAALAAALLAGAAQTASAQTVLFQESFNSGLGSFTNAGSVTTSSAGARLAGSFGGTDGSITSGAISTVGFTGITLTWTRSTTGLDSGEAGIAEFSTNGSTYTAIESAQTLSGSRTVALPSSAAGINGLRLRFRINASLSSEYYTVDEIRLTGTTGGGDPDPSDNPLQRGPDPTVTSLQAANGPYAVASVTVSSTAANGYGGGTIYYPTSTSDGPFAVVSVAPGYVSPQSSIQQWGPRLASWGFVAITITTNSSFDQPASRATQLVAALNQVVSYSNSGSHPISGKVDASRRAVMGWSMGGGGSLIAARDNPSTIKAAVPLAPYNSSSNFSTVRQPVLIFACESDGTAPVSSHALPMYQSLPSTNDKAFAEVNNGSHSCANDPRNNSGVLGKYGVSWMKRFMDNDLRFDPYLCGAPHQTQLQGTVYSRYFSTCPY
jgi:dienelactone hydrolase